MLPSSSYYYTRQPCFYTYAPVQLIGQAVQPAPESASPVPPPVPSPPEPGAGSRAVSEPIAAGISQGVQDAFQQITIPVIAIAIVTGASFAIGTWLAHRFILPKEG